jgi:carbonic anhydrase
MDGRIQLPVIKYLQTCFDAEFVDLVTEAGPTLILATQSNMDVIESILARIHLSVSKHGSVGIAVIGHHDCAANPASKAEQLLHIRDSLSFLRQHYQDTSLIGLWVDENWEVSAV